jgi:undecaprenyl-diphosphatase
MLDFMQVITLALVQGLTEFLPISSSAHLILVPVLSNWGDQGLAFDVAVHVGTLLAVILYFRQDLKLMLTEWLRSFHHRVLSPDAQLAWAVLLATIPTGVAGWLFNDFVTAHLRSPLVVASTTIGFGLLLWWADVGGRRVRDEHSITWTDVIVIGCAQALAIVPGTSRSGITITAGLAMGLTREAAARFSFLLAIPVILLAGGYQSYTLALQPQPAPWAQLALGVLVSGISAYLCIHLFLKLLKRSGMLPFVIYRMLLGGILLLLFY